MHITDVWSCDFELSLLFKHLRSKPCDRLNVFTLAGAFVQLLEKVEIENFADFEFFKETFLKLLTTQVA